MRSTVHRREEEERLGLGRERKNAIMGEEGSGRMGRRETYMMEEREAEDVKAG